MLQALHQAVAQRIVRHRLAGDADDAEIVGQQVARREIVERGDHQPVRQIAGDAEDDEAAGIGLVLMGGMRPSRTAGLRLGDVGRVLARRIRMLLRLLVAAEPVAHRGKDLLGEGVLLARAEARIQRGGQHLGRDRLVDGGIDGPAAFAGILDKAGIIVERRDFRRAPKR